MELIYRNQTLENYLDDLAAKIPAPGGGSACAFTAGCAAALISMVVNFTLGKPKYARYEKTLKKILSRAEKLRKKFLELTDADVLAYQSKDIKKSLGVPYQVAGLCFEGIKLCPDLVKKGNVHLISDVAVAAILWEAAFTSAYFNVEINLKSLKGVGLCRRIHKDLQMKMKKIRGLREDIEIKIARIIKK